jgi:histone H1/5
MTEETKVSSPKPEVASPKKKAAPKKTAAPKTKKAAVPKAKKAAGESGPSYIDLIIEAIISLKERSGSSRQAISKYVSAKKSNFASHFLNKALRTAVEGGKLVQVKGSYKVAAAQKKKAAPKKAAAKKPAAKKDAKPAAKTASKKVSAKKAKKAASPKKKASAKPKKVTSKAAKKVTKKAKAPAKK